MSEEKKPNHSNVWQALSAVQGELKNARLDSVNPHFKNKYASLEAYLSEARPLLAKHSLSVTQGCLKDGDEWVLKTRITYSGDVEASHIESSMPLLLSKQDMQGLGSAITYARRYGLAAMLGMGSEDDDAQGATTQASGPQSPTTIKAAPIKPGPAPAAPFQPRAGEVGAAPDWTEYRKEVTNFDPGEYVIKFGKDKGKSVHQIDADKLEGFATWMVRQSEADKKPMSALWSETYCFMMAHLEQIRKHKPSEPPPMPEDELPF